MAVFTKEASCTNCNLKMNLFCHLNETELEVLNQNRFEVNFNKGEVIFKQGGPLTHIICLTTGQAKIYIEGQEKKNMILKIVKPTELVGGPGFPVDFRHHFTVSALEKSTACLIDIHSFEEVLKMSPTFAFEFIRYLNQSTIELHEKLMNLTHKQMHGRIADSILYLSEKIYNKPSFEVNLTRQDIGEMTAMTKESAIRILKELKEDGIIDFENNRFTILNESALQKISLKG